MGNAHARGRTSGRRLLHSILASEWAIRQEWLGQFAGIASRLEAEGGAQLSAEEIRVEIRRALATLNDGQERPESLAVEYGEPMGEGLRASVRDGIAIIPVIGPLFHYASEFDDVCGCTSYQQIARDINAVRTAAGEIRGALFDFDTPGGEVAGVSETAALIRELSEEMPVWGFSSDLICSAGYWLGSATSELWLADTARAGSIGVAAAYRAKGKNSGVIEIVSSQSPKKRPNVETEEGRAQVRATLDALADVFIAAVARYRAVSVEKVLSDFGEGDVLVGAHAVTAGLADRIGTFEGALAELVQRAPASRRGTAATAGEPDSTSSEEQHMSKENPVPPAADSKPSELTAEGVAKDHPAIAEAFRVEGATRERTRILAIEGLTIKGYESVIQAAKEDPSCSVEMAAVKLVQAQQATGTAEKDAGKKHLKAVRADEELLDPPAPAAAGEGDPNSDEAVAARILGAGRVARAKS